MQEQLCGAETSMSVAPLLEQNAKTWVHHLVSLLLLNPNIHKQLIYSFLFTGLTMEMLGGSLLPLDVWDMADIFAFFF